MNTLFFETGDYITDENGEPLYVLATPARYNDKYYVVRAVETKTNRDCLLKFVEITDDSYKLNNLQREGAFCFYLLSIPLRKHLLFFSNTSESLSSMRFLLYCTQIMSDCQSAPHISWANSGCSVHIFVVRLFSL